MNWLPLNIILWCIAIYLLAIVGAIVAVVVGFLFFGLGV